MDTLNPTKLLMARDERAHVKSSIDAVLAGKQFLYLWKQDNGNYSIGSVTEEYFNEFNLEYEQAGLPSQKMVRVTERKLKILIKYMKFKNTAKDMNMLNRAKIFYEIIKHMANN